MATERKLEAEVLTPEGEVFKGKLQMLSTRTAVGEVGILAEHIPMVARLVPAELRLLIDISAPYFDRSAQKWGQKVLYIAPWPGAGLWTKKKVTTLAELKGLKTRTYDKNGALVMDRYAIPREERYLERRFGPAYLEFKRRVRRWL